MMKKSRIVYIIFCILSFVIIGLLFRVPVSIFAFSVIISIWITKKEQEKLFSVILDNCDPNEFIKKYQIMFGKTRNNRTILSRKLNLCLGYFGIEDYLLSQNLITNHDYYSMYINSMAYYNLCICYMKICDFEKARLCHKKASRV